MLTSGLPQWLSGKESAYNEGATGDVGLIPGVGKIPWRRAWGPTPVFLPGESHGQRSLAGCSPWGRKESDTAETTEHKHAFYSKVPECKPGAIHGSWGKL